MIEKILKLFPPEVAHGIAKWGMRHRLAMPGPYLQTKTMADGDTQARWYPKLFGVPLNNDLGLAAGFDKNGELVDSIEHYGFGFVEVGSVTFLGGKGNPKPRMFRISAPGNEHGIMNRMGLNGQPAYEVSERLRYCTSKAYGVNIAKTHSPEIVGDAAIRDMVGAYKDLQGLGAYTALNISCPNTREGKTFEETGALRDLLQAITDTESAMQSINLRQPLLVKFSPTLVDKPSHFSNLIDVCKRFNINGYIFCNTLPMDHPQYGKGGASGPWVKQRAIILIKWARDYGVKEPIIACGGIFTGQDIVDYRSAGADFFQAYNGYVRGPNAGPMFAHRVLADADRPVFKYEPVCMPVRDDEMEDTSLGQSMVGKTSLD